MRRWRSPTQVTVYSLALTVLVVAGILAAIAYARHAVTTGDRQWCVVLGTLLHTLPHHAPLYAPIVRLAHRFGCGGG